MIICADRGYVKEALWTLLAQLGAGFLLICDPDHLTTGHPFIGASCAAASKHDEDLG